MNLNWLYLGLYGFFMIDWTLTVWTIIRVRKRYPKLDYTKFELNRIARKLWNKFGFEKGSAVIFVAISLLYWVMYFAFMRNNMHMFWFMLGVYSIVFTAHANNLILGSKKSWFHDMYMKAYKELPFKEDRISDLIKERDTGKWGGDK